MMPEITITTRVLSIELGVDLLPAHRRDDLEEEKKMRHCCAECGMAGGGVIMLTTCKACMQVK
jgi:hypothetical protein